MRPVTFTRRAGILATVAVVALSLAGGVFLSAQADDKGAKYRATAIDMDAPAGQVATPLDIIIERWSTDAEKDKVTATLLEASQEKLLAVIQALPRIGTIHVPGNVGWGLRYARHGVEADGRDRILIVSDRPISFYEAREKPRSIDYPFSIIEMRVGSNSRGEGKLLFSAKMGIDRRTNTLVLENYGIQPIALNDVRREKP
jgi:hypothetical protein